MDTVLVVGGRTTGLMMAAELARRGVPTRCIDKSPGIDPHVRANLIHSRTLEIFQGLGLDAKATVGSVPEIGLAFYRDGARFGESPHAPVDSPFPFGMSQSQAHTEATLETHLNSLGVEVERNVSLTALSQDEDGVTVTLQRDGAGQETGRFQWVIACDGAHSSVRHFVGLDFPGEADGIPYILGDVLIDGDDDLEADKGHIFFHDSGELYVFTRLPGNRHFIVATLNKDAETAGAASLEELQAIISERGRPTLRLHDPHWLGFFRISYRLVPHYREDRVFLAGDAAHVHSLLAGQGMNTGIQDAHNLAWKLALVAKQKASADLLDSYESERRVVANEVVETTRKITNMMESYANLSKEERDTFVANLFTPEAAKKDAARHLQELDLDYGASPLSLSLDDDFGGGPAPGTRAPDAEGLAVNNEATSLFKLPADDQFRLLLFCGVSNDAPAADIQRAADSSKRFASWLKPYVVSTEQTRGPFTDHDVIVDGQGKMHRNFAADRPCIYLLRPDGYVAYRSKDLASVATYFEHLGMFRA